MRDVPSSSVSRFEIRNEFVEFNIWQTNDLAVSKNKVVHWILYAVIPIGETINKRGAEYRDWEQLLGYKDHLLFVTCMNNLFYDL